jgi:hypothetical protein
MSELHAAYLFDITARPVSGREIEVEVWAHSKEWAQRWAEALVNECLDFRACGVEKKSRMPFAR